MPPKRKSTGKGSRSKRSRPDRSDSAAVADDVVANDVADNSPSQGQGEEAEHEAEDQGGLIQAIQSGNYDPFSDNLSRPLNTICGGPDSHLPKSIVEKITSGSYVEFYRLLPSETTHSPENSLNLVLTKNGQISLAPRKEPAKVISFEEWCDAFITYMYVYLKVHNNKAAELLIYFNTIRKMFRKYRWKAARDYDEEFRRRMAKNPLRSWATIDGELFMFCMPSPLDPVPRIPISSQVTQNKKGVCFAYNNREQCKKKLCRFEHKCAICSRQHPSSKCTFRGNQAGGERTSR